MLKEYLLKKSFCNQPFRRLMVVMITAMHVAVGAGFVLAQEKLPNSGGNKSEERYHITSDRLVSEFQAKTAEFIGNVTATQGEMVITSDRLKIYYEDEQKQNSQDSVQTSVNKIIASGNVTIKMENRVATTEQAVYIMKNNVLILTGSNSKITSGENSVSGDKITMFRNEDKMIVEGSSEERVEAILYTKEKGSN